MHNILCNKRILQHNPDWTKKRITINNARKEEEWREEWETMMKLLYTHQPLLPFIITPLFKQWSNSEYLQIYEY